MKAMLSRTNPLFPAILGSLIMLFALASASAQEMSPVGRWKTISDEDGKPRSIVEIVDNGGVYEGFVRERFARDTDDPEGKCRKCPGERKDQPVIGMKILWGLKKDGKEYKGGEILDPTKGKIYKAKMALSEDGKTLNVRGFIGVSLIGRTQTWHREP